MSVARSLAFLLPVAVLGALPACGGKEVVRGAHDPSIDSHAVSTGLDKDDIQRALSETLNNLRAAPVMNEWRATHPPPIVAIFPFQNTTSEHIDSMLAAMLSEAETWLVESGTVSVVSRERQAQMIREVEGQQNAVFNPAKIATYGRLCPSGSRCHRGCRSRSGGPSRSRRRRCNQRRSRRSCP